MFERYTEKARRLVFWARYFASQVGASEIDTEHLLLGLLREDMGLAERLFGSPWALEQVWGKLAPSMEVHDRPAAPRDLPLSKASKRVLCW